VWCFGGVVLAMIASRIRDFVHVLNMGPATDQRKTKMAPVAKRQQFQAYNSARTGLAQSGAVL
jgi:hypothetical protein